MSTKQVIRNVLLSLASHIPLALGSDYTAVEEPMPCARKENANLCLYTERECDRTYANKPPESLVRTQGEAACAKLGRYDRMG